MQRIADYQLLRELGAGHEGRTFVATPPARLQLDVQQVTVKVLDGEASREQFQRVGERLRQAASVHSACLVRLHDVGYERGRIFYSMEYFPEGSLQRAQSTLDRAGVLGAVQQAAWGSHALHKAGLVHRNIKPANIMVGQERAVLCDLGLAQARSPGLTTTGWGRVGSLEYTEPAVICGQRAGPASDVWSLGATLHQALTGRSIFGAVPDADAAAVLRHLLTTAPEVDAGLDPDIRRLVERCLGADGGERFATAEAVATAIGRLLPGRPSAPVGGGGGTTTRHPLPGRQYSPGVLVLDTGEAYSLDASYVLGREPLQDPAVVEGRSRGVTLTDPERSISRVHVEIRPEGGQVIAMDRASANGTYLQAPGQERWSRLRPNERVALEPHARITLGLGRRVVVYMAPEHRTRAPSP